MSDQLLINAAWAVVVWTAAAVAAVVLLVGAPAVLRRNVCRAGLAGVPAILGGAVLVTRARPEAGLLLRPADPAGAALRRTPRPVATPPASATLGKDAEPLLPPAWPGPGETLPHALPSPLDRSPARPGDAPDRPLRINWPAAVFAAAAAVAAAGMLVLAWRLGRLVRWRRTWRPAPGAWVSLTRRVARRMGLRRRFDVYLAPGLSQPAAAGVFRGAIVLPERAPLRVGAALRAALAHELGHLAGRDPAWCVLGRAVAALAWWCPAAWWLRRRAETESELAADD